MMVLVTNMARAALIVSVATTMGAVRQQPAELPHPRRQRRNHEGGDRLEPVTRKTQIDKSLAWMQVALSSIDAIKIMNDPGLLEDKTRALFFIGMGTGGPAITAGAMLMLYEIAMALFIGWVPCSSSACCSTRPSSCSSDGCSTASARCSRWPYLQRWFHRAGQVVRVAAAFWTTALVQGVHLKESMSDGMTSQAMQQGGMGLILTALILTTPPMAAMFFQGTWAPSWHIRR
jgi:type IV secretion system protein VirB6